MGWTVFKSFIKWSIIFWGALFLISAMLPTDASAHGGGLNSQGCHKQTSNNTYHCHRNNTKTKPTVQKLDKPKGSMKCDVKTSSVSLSHTDKPWFYFKQDSTGVKITDNYVTFWIPNKGTNQNGSFIKTNNRSMVEIVNPKRKVTFVLNKSNGEFFWEFSKLFQRVSLTGYCK